MERPKIEHARQSSTFVQNANNNGADVRGVSLSRIEQEMYDEDDDIEDPVVMSEVSIDNPIRNLREKMEHDSPD